MPHIPIAVYSPVLVRVLRVEEVDLDRLGRVQHVVEFGGILLVIAVMTGNLGNLVIRRISGIVLPGASLLQS